MRKGLFVLALGAALTAGAAAAEAMPAANFDGANAAPELTLVSGGCGIGFHRTPWGYCRPNGWVRPYGYRYGWGWHRPWGWHRGWHRW